jgi:hypothetical protein
MKDCVHILGRLYAASQKPIEVRHLVPFDPKACSFKYLDSPLADNNLRRTLFYKGDEDFAAVYMVDALLSRGAHVKDQLLVYEAHRSAFIKKLIDIYDEGRGRRVS